MGGTHRKKLSKLYYENLVSEVNLVMLSPVFIEVESIIVIEVGSWRWTPFLHFIFQNMWYWFTEIFLHETHR